MHQSNNKLLLCLMCLTVVPVISGCGPSAPTRSDPVTINPAPQLEELLMRGQYIEAGDHYMTLAEQPELDQQQRDLYLLNAADAYRRGNDVESAKRLLEQIGTSSNLKNLVQADILLSQNLATQALVYLTSEGMDQSGGDLGIRIIEARAKSYELLANPVPAAIQRILLHTLLTPDKRQDNNKKIWLNLSGVHIDVLKRQRLLNTDLIKSWIELAIIYQSSFLQPDIFNLQLQSWARQYPDHPANTSLVYDLVAASRESGIKPDQVALILPFSGAYAPYSKAIREGFMAAWYASSDYRPTIEVYDANSLNITEAYQKAINEGAEFIVGPLEKEGIKALIDQGELPVPVLALNQYLQDDYTREGGSTSLEIPNLIQFGLVPEDETRQVAITASEQGYSKALIIAPEGEWGDRLIASFASEWTNRGNRIVSYVSYRNSLNDFSLPVKNLLNIASSENRAKTLQQKLNKSVKSETRLRDDADMIFLIAGPVKARQLVPQFRFHRATHLPIFSTSYIYSGIKAPELDSDVNGVQFTDIPWVIDAKDSRLKQVINQNWQADKTQYNRLYALGIDAYQIIPDLKRLSEQRSISFTGQTGELYMAADGRIRRNSIWAQFEKGVPASINKDEL